MSVTCLIVTAGILTAQEFASLNLDQQIEVERTTRDLIGRCGSDSLRRDRERHRSELWLAYGVPEG